MKKFVLNKIVRDKVHQRYIETGAQVACTPLSPQEVQHHLKAKLIEEVQEVCQATTQANLTEELADVLEVLHVLAHKNGITLDTIQRIQDQKREDRGSFQNAIYINTVAMDDHHPMIDHLLSQPEKYPQTTA